jgi:hypothetical protein
MTMLVILLAAMLIAPVTPDPKGATKARSSRPAAKSRATPTPQPVLLRGTLLDESRTPIAGRTVYLFEFQSGERPVIMPTGDRAIERSQSVSCSRIEGKWDHPQSTTDSTGRFSIPLDEFYRKHAMDLYQAVPSVPAGALGYLEKDSCQGFRKPDDSFVVATFIGLQPKDLGEVIVKNPERPPTTPTPNP